MTTRNFHSFHIPVMGLGFSIDTPIKVAHLGISSVISIVEDELIEEMRKHYCHHTGRVFIPVRKDSPNSRSERIKAYLNLVNEIVEEKSGQLKTQTFDPVQPITTYFELLPDNSPVRIAYEEMLEMKDPELKFMMQESLRRNIIAGPIDVNIMSKVDREKEPDADGVNVTGSSDALTAFRGFAESNLQSSVVFSAGYNPRLYAYIESFADFFPDPQGNLRKKIILKVSDFRSALTQGRLLAKKGLWISEFRIESGLNCGGHAFATEGLLLGPILEEFKTRKDELIRELFESCNQALVQKNKPGFLVPPKLKLTAQGGIGTANEHSFLLEHYQLDSAGWGSPFLLVPEATNVDEETLNALASAKEEDYYLSNTSPLGVKFNNFRKSSSENQRKVRIEKGRPGSPCYKKFLASNTEFTEKPICTASRQYQHLKIKELRKQNLSPESFTQAFHEITEKDCLCAGLGSSALIKNHIPAFHQLKAVVICPGPNLAYFSGVFSLKQMIDHIYGRTNLLNKVKRSNLFVNEFRMYVDYLKSELKKNADALSGKHLRSLQNFKNNLLQGAAYYRNLLPNLKQEAEQSLVMMLEELNLLERSVKEIAIPC